MTIFLQALEVVAAQGQLFVCWLHNTQHTQHNIHQHNTTHNTQHSVLSTGLRVHGQHGESSLQFRLHILLCCQVVWYLRVGGSWELRIEGAAKSNNSSGTKTARCHSRTRALGVRHRPVG
jgi:hypothetical protein